MGNSLRNATAWHASILQVSYRTTIAGCMVSGPSLLALESITPARPVSTHRNPQSCLWREIGSRLFRSFIIGINALASPSGATNDTSHSSGLARFPAQVSGRRRD